MCVPNVTLSIRVNRKCWIQLAVLTSFVVSTACNSFPALSKSSFKGAPQGRFLVCTGQLLLLLLLPLLANSKPLCSPLKDPAKVRLTHVIEGDTVVLENGEHLRLIGIDTPETGYKRKLSEPGALAAKDKLNTLVQPGQQYLLDRGIERQDRYDRSLGHLFLSNGENIQALLLAQGLATVLNIPPNIRYSKCYAQQSDRAITKGRGLWKLDQFQARAASRLTIKERGYRLIIGMVTNVRSNSSST
jgi:endonuclease YncB( thermonuclease family)